MTSQERGRGSGSKAIDAILESESILDEIARSRRELREVRGLAVAAPLVALYFLLHYRLGNEVAFLGFVTMAAGAIGVWVMWLMAERKARGALASRQEKLAAIQEDLEDG